MNMNNSLTNALNDAIDKHGFRISPRLSLGDRLARYTQLYYESQGRWVDDDDARAAASMMMLKYSEADRNPRKDKMFTDDAAPLKAPRRKSVSFVSQPTQPIQTHTMTRRSQVSPR
jgi:hypothetical protein